MVDKKDIIWLKRNQYRNCLRAKFLKLSNIHYSLRVYNAIEKEWVVLEIFYNNETEFLRILNSHRKIVNRFLDRYNLQDYNRTDMEKQVMLAIENYKINQRIKKRDNSLERILDE